jgi:Zn finger protein HypA/HybF involved in hydrogenase expression
MDEQDLRLDGNAEAGLFREIFTVELTTARGRCESCGAVAEVGAVMVYANAPGAVMRCPQCESVLMRIVSNGGRHWLDARGISWLELRA